MVYYNNRPCAFQLFLAFSRAVLRKQSSIPVQRKKEPPGRSRRSTVESEIEINRAFASEMRSFQKSISDVCWRS